MKALSRATLVALLYVVTAGAWIHFSGDFALDASHTREELEAYERMKGLGFVVVTGLGLFVTTFFVMRRLIADGEEAARDREALMSAERQALAGLFVGSITHDANNVATVVLSALELLDEQPLDAEGRSAVHDAQHAMARLVALFKDLKGLGRRRGSADLTETCLNEAIEHAVALLQGHSAMRHCHVTLSLGPPVTLPLFADLVDSMLINLLINAAQATRGVGRLEVKLSVVDGFARIEVHDDGPGVPPEQVAQLFKPFHTTKPNGTGLGLVSVQQAALAHQGRVEHSRSPLGGACFTVSLPVPARG